MSRKLTASAFLLVMTLLIALKHPVLGYCLCLDSYFAGGCVCQVENQSATPDDEMPCYGCCSADSAETNEPEPARQDPCSDCEEVLFVDVGDFIWQGVEIPSDSETPGYQSSHSLTDLQIPAASYYGTAKSRGDPPPGLLTGTPLYLRHSVLRL